MGGARSTHERDERRCIYEILIGKPEGKRALRRKGNSLGKCGLDSSVSGRDQWWALVNTIMNIWVP
jgi:hypothetical protein